MTHDADGRDDATDVEREFASHKTETYVNATASEHVTRHKVTKVSHAAAQAIPTMSEPPLSINCLLLGSDSSEVFEVEILKTKKVSFLKDLIKQRQSHRLNHVDASAHRLEGVSPRGHYYARTHSQ